MSVLESDLAQVRPSATGMLIRVSDVIGIDVIGRVLLIPIPRPVRVIRLKSIPHKDLGQIKFSIGVITKTKIASSTYAALSRRWLDLLTINSGARRNVCAAGGLVDVIKCKASSPAFCPIASLF